MKRFFIGLIIFFLASAKTLQACDYELTLNDSYGDGWNGASLDVFINSTLAGNITLSSGSTGTWTITLSDGDVLDFTFYSGSYDSECSWVIYNSTGSEVCTGTPSTTQCDGTVAVCSVAVTPCATSDCSDATLISTLPYTHSGQTTCGGCSHFDSSDGCGSDFMSGNDKIYRYTPSSDGWVSFEAQTSETNGGYERGAAIFVLDACPSNAAANCIASSTVQYPANHGSPITIANLTAGVAYYIIVSNGPHPVVHNGDACINYNLLVSNVSQPAPTAEDCYGARPICGATITEATPGNGQGSYPSEINSSSSCLEGERNGNWYTFKAEGSGTMTVNIQPATDTDDYDFALYNVTTGGCEGVFSGASTEVACNYSIVDGGGDTGINSAVAEADFESTITVNAGETYMLYVSQWSVSTSGFTITLGGTADYIDNVGPTIASVDQPNCAQNEVVVNLSENVLCSSIASNGSDFTLTNPAGSTLTITGASSAICSAGGTFTDQVVLTLSGNITIDGLYEVKINTGALADQCSHTAPAFGTEKFFTITQPTITAGSNSPICAGNTLSLTETGAQANAWSWTGPNSFSSTSQNPNISSATTAATGTYTVTGTITATGCARSATVSATVNALPTASASSNSPVCTGASLTLTGGAAGMTSYSWSGPNSFSSTTQSPTVSSSATSAMAGTYTITVTNSNNCTNTASVAVTVNTLPTVTASASSTDICEGTSLTLTGGGANTYTWSHGATNGVAFVPAVGSYTYTVTGTNTTTTCQNTATVGVVVGDAPEVNAGADASICANQTYGLTGSFGGGASSATWSRSGTGTFSNTTMSPTYTPSGSDISLGSVTITLTTNDPAGACIAASDQMVLTINPMESAAFSYLSGTYCNTASDPTPTITGTPGGTFSAPAQLSINSSTGLIDVSVSTIGGPYAVTYTTPGTCLSSSTFNISITSGADAQFSYTSPICNSSANPLPAHTTGSNGAYSSTAGLVFVNTGTGEINLASTIPGTYTITNNVDLGACGTDVETYSVTIDQAVTVFAGNDATLCESALSYALSTASITGSVIHGTWSTSFAGGLFANAFNTNTNYTFGSNPVGTVTLTLTSDAPSNSCPAVSDQVVLTIQDAAEVSAGADATICAGQTYTLAGTQGGSTSNIGWTRDGTGTFSSSTSLTPVYTPSGADVTDGSIILTISSDNPTGACGVVTDQMVLTINPLPTVTAGSNSPVCEGGTLNLTTTGNATAWVWTGTGSYNPADVQNPSTSSVATTATATYTVVGTIVATGCQNTSNVSVVVNAKPTVTAGSNSPVCVGATLNLTTTGNATSWVWTGGYNPDDIQNPVHTNTVLGDAASYTVVGTNAASCSATSTVTVTVNALPTVTATASDNTVCEGTSVTLTGGGANNYSWSGGVTNAVGFVPALGTTAYTVTGTNTTTGCTNTASTSIIVSPLATANAGSDATICANATHTLSGSFGGGASSAAWSSNGTGTFDNNASMSATYTPSASDITAGSVTLTLTTNDPASDCNAASDAMLLTITPMENANFAYDGGTFCISGSNPVPISISTPGGVFSESNALVINASTGEINLASTGIGGPYTLTYTTPGTCSSSSNVSITITSGFDAEFSYSSPNCSSSSNILPSHVTGSNGTYSSTAGLSFANNSTGEINLGSSLSGSYTVTNTISASGGCAQDVYTFDITIDQAATVFTGNDATVCSSDFTYNLTTATIGGSATSVTWTTSGDGTFDDAASVTPVYTFGAGDIGTSVTLTATTNNPGTSCGAVSDAMVLTVNQAAIVTAGSDAVICAGQTVPLSGTLGGSTSAVSWSTSGNGTFVNGSNLVATYTPSADDITAGTVVLTISSDDPTGPCSLVQDSKTVTINPLPVVTATSNSPICSGTALVLDETSGQADSWTWTGTGSYDPADVQNPSSTASLVSYSGTYTVTGTITATGCSASSDVTVVVNPTPVVVAQITQNDICSGENVVLNETGTEATSWAWSSTNGYASTEQNPTIYTANSDTSGWYVVTGTIDLTGCSAKDSVDVNVFALPTIGYTCSDADQTICDGETVTLSGTGTSVSYTWNQSVNDGVAFAPTSTQTYWVIGEDANGCIDSTSTVVTVNLLPNVFAGNDQTIPYGGNTTLNETTPAGLNYSWVPADSLVNASVQHPVTVNLFTSNLFTLTGTDPLTGCSNTDDLLIQVVGGPLSVNVIAQANDSVCFGSAVQIQAIVSGGGTVNYHYNWTSNPAMSLPDSAILGLDTLSQTTEFYLEVVEGGVNHAFDTIKVTVMPLPVGSQVNVQDLTCFGNASGSIEIVATGTLPLSYSINGGVTFGSNSQFTNLSAGTGFITVIEDDFGCRTYADTVDILQPAVLSVSQVAVTDASCGNLNGSASVSTVGGTSPYAYLWPNGDASDYADTLGAGSYQVTVSDANACQDTLTVSVANEGGGYVTIDQKIDVNCYGMSNGSVSVTMNQGFPSYNFYLDLSGTHIDSVLATSDSTQTFNNLAAGVYQLIANEGAGCQSVVNVSILSANQIVIAADIDSLICYQNQTGAINITVSGGFTPYQFTWVGSNAFSSNSEDLQLLESGTYTVSLRDSLACTVTSSAFLVSEPNEAQVAINIGNAEQCYGSTTGSVAAFATGGTQPYVYAWTNGSWTEGVSTVDSLPAGSYHLLVRDAHNCFVADSTVSITEYSQIIVHDTVIYSGADAQIELTVSGGTPAYAYHWENSDLQTLSDEASINNLKTGLYYVTVSDFYGCAVSKFFDIEIPFVIPTLMTPNADGLNDTWGIGNIEQFENISIEIYNRWGNIIFKYEGKGSAYADVSNQFDGTFNGKELPLGSYVYILDLKQGNEPVHQGTLSIVRTK